MSQRVMGRILAVRLDAVTDDSEGGSDGGALSVAEERESGYMRLAGWLSLIMTR
jgi:hypothetical protein